MTDKANVIGAAPELAGQPDSVFTFWIRRALRRVNSKVWPAADLLDAQTIMAAHLITLKISGAGGGAGAVTSKSVGAVSVGFQGVTNDSQSDLKLTQYGRIFLAMQRNLGLTPRAVVTGRHVPAHRGFA